MLYIESNYTILERSLDNTILKIELEKKDYNNIIEQINKEMFLNIVRLNRTIVLYSINILSKDKDSSDIHSYDFYINFIAKNPRKDIIIESKEYTFCLNYKDKIYPFKVNLQSGLILHPKNKDTSYYELDAKE